jgi:hypothetical protein
MFEGDSTKTFTDINLATVRFCLNYLWKREKKE